MEVARGKLMKGQLIGSQFTAELNTLIDTIEVQHVGVGV